MLGEPISRKKPIQKRSNAGLITCIIAVLMVLFQVTKFFKNMSSAIEGIFGVYAYALFVLLFALGLMIKYAPGWKISKRYIILSCIMIFALFTAVHLAFTNTHTGTDFMSYLSYSFNNLTPGGVIFSVVSYALVAVFVFEGSLVVLASAFIIAAAFFGQVKRDELFF